MRKYIILSLFIFILALTGCLRKKTEENLNVMSFNVRYNNPADGINAWPNRKEMARQVIIENNADVIGMQEVLHSQLEDLIEILPEYTWYGVGRDDGEKKGEYVPIFYHKERFEAITASSFWLSDTPVEIGSVGWDAALPRIASWIELKNLASGENFYVLNTHFDHLGTEARKKSAELILDFIGRFDRSLPLIITGDFNCEEKDEPYKIMTGKNKNTQQLYDSFYITENEHEGGIRTFNGFGTVDTDRIIDYIFVNFRVKVNTHKFLKIQKGETFISDHYPILSNITLKRGFR